MEKTFPRVVKEFYITNNKARLVQLDFQDSNTSVDNAFIVEMEVGRDHFGTSVWCMLSPMSALLSLLTSESMNTQSVQTPLPTKSEVSQNSSTQSDETPESTVPDSHVDENEDSSDFSHLPKNRKLTHSEAEGVKAYILRGCSIDEIEKHFNIPRPKISVIKYKLKSTVGALPLTKYVRTLNTTGFSERFNSVIERLNQGKSLQEVTKETGINYKTVHSYKSLALKKGLLIPSKPKQDSVVTVQEKSVDHVQESINVNPTKFYPKSKKGIQELLDQSGTIVTECYLGSFNYAAVAYKYGCKPYDIQEVVRITRSDILKYKDLPAEDLSEKFNVDIKVIRLILMTNSNVKTGPQSNSVNFN